MSLRFADEVTTDVHGNVIVARNPQAPLRVMLAGHCDQIGFLVQYIDEEGFLYVLPIGGWDPMVLIGQRMTVWASSGPIFGVIARKPIHLLTDEERKEVPKLKDLWLDIGCANKEEAAKLVRVGDPVTVELGFTPMRGGLGSFAGMDNKSGLWVVIEALRRTQSQEVELRVVRRLDRAGRDRAARARTSAFGIDPHVGIAIDVTHATDCPTIDKKQEGDIAPGQGPGDLSRPEHEPARSSSRLLETAAAGNVPYQMAASGRATPNDANTIQISRAGVATGLVSIPNRYMHSPVEMISLDDIDQAADLLAGFALRLVGDESFTPEYATGAREAPWTTILWSSKRPGCGCDRFASRIWTIWSHSTPIPM